MQESKSEFVRRLKILKFIKKEFYPGLLTAGNLFSGFASILATISGKYIIASSLIILAMLFDAFDGKVARLVGASGEFGKEFDSLSDIVSFGVAPALLLISISQKWALVTAAAFIYLLAGAVRLARFNVMVANSKFKGFQGLPIPGAATFVVTFTFFVGKLGVIGKVNPIIMFFITITLAYLMVSNVEYPALKGRWGWKGRIFYSIVALFLIFKVYIGLFIISCSYLLSGPVKSIYSLFAVKKIKN